MHLMEKWKKDVHGMMKHQEALTSNYKAMIDQLIKYEELNIEYYSEADLTKRILTHPSSGDVAERIESSQGNWSSTFKDAYIWIKGELLDIRGMHDAIEGR